ncbi:MAG: alpha-amylase family glycosyl hydrolase, partial [Gemmatimonadota bacterium]
MRSTYFIALLSLALTACAPDETEVDRDRDPDRASAAAVSPALQVPAWTEDAIWYQVFVERFRNGDPSNDPTLADMEGSWPHVQPAGWKPTPWGWDWYRQEPWAEATGKDIFFTLQLRRYGGDLQGVLDRLDYLEALGVTALYLNPINDAPSLHKYDARNYRHVDRNFGPDPED